MPNKQYKWEVGQKVVLTHTDEPNRIVKIRKVDGDTCFLDDTNEGSLYWRFFCSDGSTIDEFDILGMSIRPASKV